MHAWCMCAEIKQEISQKVTNPLVDLTEIKDAAVDEVSSLLLHTLSISSFLVLVTAYYMSCFSICTVSSLVFKVISKYFVQKTG